MVYVVEEPLDVALNHPVHLPARLHREGIDMGGCGVTRPAWSKPVAVRLEVALGDGFQKELEGHLYPSVVERWYAEWSELSILLRNVDSFHRHGLERAFPDLLPYQRQMMCVVAA